MYLRSLLSPSSHPDFVQMLVRRTALLAVALSVIGSAAQESSGTKAPAQIQSETVTLPAGTRFVLVLTHPIQSRYLHRGDDIYAQINSPVDSGDQMVIPPGTFVQGTLDRLEQKNGRAFLRLHSMAITVSDGYVAPASGPITLDSNDGYAVKDPGRRRT